MAIKIFFVPVKRAFRVPDQDVEKAADDKFNLRVRKAERDLDALIVQGYQVLATTNVEDNVGGYVCLVLYKEGVE